MERCKCVRSIVWIIVCVGLTAACGAVALGQQPAPAAGKSTTAAHPAASLDGEWSGTLQVAETQLHLVLHLSKNPQGQWQATVDSLDQAVYGLEASKVRRDEDKLDFEVASVGAHFQGKILPDHRAIRGIWEQGGTGLPLRFEKRAAGAETKLPSKAISKVEGTWQGAIETGNMRMRLQLHLLHDDKGQLIAAMDSLDQSIQGIPASRATEQSGELKLELAAFGAEYTGTLDATKNEIAGQW